MTINGSNFVGGATLTFVPPEGGTIPSTASKLTFVSSSQLSYQFNNGNDVGTWTVTVNNPDGQPSNAVSFTVTSGGSAPTAITGTASNITSNAATLNGTVNPNGLATTAYFQLGTTTSYGNTTPSQSLGSGTSAVPVSANLSGLSPNTTYHFRIVASNSQGSAINVFDSSFTTSNDSLVERITNGSFSSGTSGWTLVGDFWAGTNLSNYRTAPGYAAGGVDSTGVSKNTANGFMYQAVTIPSNATSATFSFWYNITSEETGSTAFDVLNVTIQNSSGGFLATVAILSNLNEASLGVYSQKTFDVTPYKGQTIRVNFLATTDGSLKTVFRIDDVSLMSNGN